MPPTPEDAAVTPARKIGDPQPSQPEDRPTHAPRPRGNSFARPLVIALLYLGGFVTGFSPIVGIVLAYIWRGDDATPEWENTHFTYLITTFWLGLVLSIVVVFASLGVIFGFIDQVADSQSAGAPVAFLMVILGVTAVWGLAAVWFCVRCIISMVKASSFKPISRPRTLLF